MLCCGSHDQGWDAWERCFDCGACVCRSLTQCVAGCCSLLAAGLFNEEARGGGGGLDEDGVAELCRAALQAGGSSESLARTLAETAVAVGSTDDVTVVVMRLGV